MSSMYKAQMKRGLVSWKVHQKKISGLSMQRQRHGKDRKCMSYFGHMKTSIIVIEVPEEEREKQHINPQI